MAGVAAGMQAVHSAGPGGRPRIPSHWWLPITPADPVPYFEHPRRVLAMMRATPDGLMDLAVCADRLGLAAVSPGDEPTREAMYAAVRIATELAYRSAVASGRSLESVIDELAVELEASIPAGADSKEPRGSLDRGSRDPDVRGPRIGPRQSQQDNRSRHRPATSRRRNQDSG